MCSVKGMKTQTKNAATILAFVVGIVSGIVTIYYAPPGRMRIIAILILVMTFLSLFIWRGFDLLRSRRRTSPLPEVNGVKAATAKYSIEQAAPEEIDWIAQLEAHVYSQKDAVPKFILKEWFNTNPNGFSIIRMNGRMIGHIDILPLRPSTLEIFREGKIVERDIPGSGLYTSEERGSIQSLYVESIIIEGQTYIRANALMHLLSNFVILINRICDPINVENIYAIAATPSGEHILKNLGFDQIKGVGERKDQHKFFSKKVIDLDRELSESFGKRYPSLQKYQQQKHKLKSSSKRLKN